MKSIKWQLPVVLLLLVNLSCAVAQDGSLTPQMVERIRTEFEMDAHARTVRNALTSTSIKDIAVDRQIVSEHNEKFSHRIKTKGISNQKRSGRCWMFAGFNTIKPFIMNKLDLDDFEFSQIYLQFWDKMEKANTFYEYMIEYRDRDLMDRSVIFLLKEPSQDGGYWENFVDLVDKYGVIPKEAMAETASSEDTGMMNRILGRILRKDALELREIYKKTGSADQMRQAKQKMLAEIFRVLVVNLGEPPKQFNWRYKLKDKKDSGDTKEDKGKQDDSVKEKEDEKGDDYKVEQKWSELRVFTPKSFYEEFVGVDLHQYVNIANDPIRPHGGQYEINMTKSLYDGHNARYASVDIGVLREVVIKMLLDNRAVCFAADVSIDQDGKTGIMASNLYDFESIYSIQMDLDKAGRILFRDSTINHSMTFIGVDLQDGKPVKWLVENSWGSERGSKGFWTMYDNWFEDNVYNVIAHKDYVPKEILQIFEKPVILLPVWDPMW